mgnify:CR=1 FL=1
MSLQATLPKLSPAEMLTLSVIIVNWNGSELLEACLDAVYRTLDTVRAEVIVVDNASTDDSVAMVGARFPQVRMIQNDVNRRFAAANNQAICESRGRYLLLLNSDTEVKPGALSALISLLDTYLNVGVVGPKLLNSDGSWQQSAYRFPTVWGESIMLLGEGVWKPLLGSTYPHYPPTEVARPVDWVTGACLMVRRDVVDAVGLIDESFFFYTEETDWCYRIRQAGWLVMYQPEAVVVHHGGGSSGGVSLQRRRLLYGSKQQFFEKHYGRRAANQYGAAVWLTSWMKMGIWQLVAALANGQRREVARHNARSYATLLGLTSRTGA